MIKSLIIFFLVTTTRRFVVGYAYVFLKYVRRMEVSILLEAFQCLWLGYNATFIVKRSQYLN